MINFKLPEAKLDPLLDLIGKYRNDPRSHKLDLGVGVYRDNDGITPVMQAVKIAEAKLHEVQQSKSYLGLTGDISFVNNLATLLFGETDATIAGAQTPGGSGGLRIAFETYHSAFANGKIWIPDPTWPNHAPLVESANVAVAVYPYFSTATQTLLFSKMIEALSQATPGDGVLLHGCCHNPTGADPDADQWQQIIALLNERQLVPIVDLAYHGLGRGLNEDLAATRALIMHCPQTMIAASASKNFGLYRDRVGAVYMAAKDPEIARRGQAYFGQIARCLYSMPPDHGAAVVDLVLADDALRRNWLAELDEMTARVQSLRNAIAEHGASLGLQFVADQYGMFSQLPLTSAQVQALVDDHAIYIAPDGRINVAGCALADAKQFVDGLASVGFSMADARA